MPADGCEQLADVAFGRPVDHADPAPRPADPQQLGGAVPRDATGQVLAGGQHRLEGAVGEGEVLGLALQERHLQPFGLGAPAGPLQQVGVAVDPDDPTEAASGRQGGVPARCGCLTALSSTNSSWTSSVDGSKPHPPTG